MEDEQSLIKKAQAGDQQAIGQLWDIITPKLFGYLINITKDRALAEDLLQSTWLKAITALPNFQLRGIKISAWIFAIARNECRQYWRKPQKEELLDSELHDTATNVHKDTEQKILVEQILNKLSPEDRELISLRYIADLSLNDIAGILKINFVTVRVRLHRALVRARLQIAKPR